MAASLNDSVLEWHRDAWASLWNHPRRPSAWLVSAPEGSGGLSFSRALACALLCQSPTSDRQACGRCVACRWLAAGNHPDFRALGRYRLGLQDGGSDEEDADLPQELDRVGKPAGTSRGQGSGEASAEAATQDEGASSDASGDGIRDEKDGIGIQAIRALAAFVFVGSHRAGLRVVLIAQADRMTLPAANALLKTLEEPPPDVVFIVQTDRPGALPATVRSRCRGVSLPRPSRAVALAWLNQALAGRMPEAHIRRELDAAGGAPMLALEWAQARQQGDAGSVWAITAVLGQFKQGLDAAQWPSFAAEKLAKAAPVEVIETMQKWVADLARVAAGGQASFFPERAQVLQTQAETSDIRRLLDCYALLTSEKRLAHHPLNAKLRFEALFIAFTRRFDR